MPKPTDNTKPSTQAGSQQDPPSEPKQSKSAKILECPSELSPAARQEWDRTVGELIAKGVLSTFDRGLLAVFCTSFALAMEAAQMVQKHGAMIKSPNGFPQQSPYLSHLNRQIEIMLRAGSELGFSPAARSRIFSFDHKNALVLETFEPDEDPPRAYTKLRLRPLPDKE
jgi:P27 family predicted phage terminase small subunit